MPFFEYTDNDAPTPQAVRIYYEIHDQTGSTGRPLLFLHGRGGNVLSWWQQVPFFARNYRCIVIEQRGWGRSEGVFDAPWGEVFARDIHALADELDLDTFAVIAQSMGGWTLSALCERLAEQGQSERIAAAVMSGTVGGYVPTHLGATYDAYREKAYAQRTAWQQGKASHPALAATTSDNLQMLYSMMARLNQPPKIGAGAPDALVRRDSFRVPEKTFFIAGEEDILCPPDIVRGVVETLPEAKHTFLPNIGHSPYFEDAETFNQLVSEFLQAVYPAQVD
jgi:3-oxoadipate enol-lactonase